MKKKSKNVIRNRKFERLNWKYKITNTTFGKERSENEDKKTKYGNKNLVSRTNRNKTVCLLLFRNCYLEMKFLNKQIRKKIGK